LGFVANERKEISTQYGLVSTQSVAAIQRALLSLEREGGKAFFGEPALELGDLMRTDLNGRGIVNILAADQLILKPRLYSNFLLWLLSELFESLPEVGDLDKPKLVFFFDEAHLLFDDAPPTVSMTDAGWWTSHGCGIGERRIDRAGSNSSLHLPARLDRLPETPVFAAFAQTPMRAS